MPRTSTIARHEKREEIEAAIVRGDPVREIAIRYGLSKTAVQDYKPDIAVRIADGETSAMQRATDYLDELCKLRAKAVQLLDDAMGTDDKRLALLAMKEAREFIQLEGKWTGQFKDSPAVQVNTQINLDLMPATMRALESVPCACGRQVDAREYVRKCLLGGVHEAE